MRCDFHLYPRLKHHLRKIRVHDPTQRHYPLADDPAVATHVPTTTTTIAPPMGARSGKSGAAVGSHAVSTLSVVAIAPATHPMSAAPSVTSTGKRAIRVTNTVLPHRISGTLRARPRMSKGVCPWAAAATARMFVQAHHEIRQHDGCDRRPEV